MIHDKTPSKIASSGSGYWKVPKMLKTMTVLNGLAFVLLLLMSGASSPHIAEPVTIGEDEGEQTIFQTPQAAVDAMLLACRDNDTEGLIRIFGTAFRWYIDSPDKQGARQTRLDVYERAQAQLDIEDDGDEGMLVIIGVQQWPFPIPLVKAEDGWRFDTSEGVEEILNRRIGASELNAIAICREYVSAQVEYAAADRDGDEVLEFAQRLASTTGKRDGLFWPIEPDSGEPLSPFGPLVAESEIRVESHLPDKPFRGYYFRILTQQGHAVPGGRYNYVINGNMIAGFAMVAYPADYRSTGVMTFVVNHRGKIYQKDLGDETADVAGQMNEYSPDRTWSVVEGY